MLMNLPTAPATEFHEQSRLKTIPLPACFKADGEKAAQAISVSYTHLTLPTKA